MKLWKTKQKNCGVHKIWERCECVCVCVCDTAQIINHTCKTVLMETGQHAGWIRVPDGLNLGTMWTQSGYYHTGLIWAHTGIHMFPMYIMGPLCRPQWGPYNLNPHVLGMVVVLVLSIHYSIPILCYAGGEWFRFVTFGQDSLYLQCYILKHVLSTIIMSKTVRAPCAPILSSTWAIQKSPLLLIIILLCILKLNLKCCFNLIYNFFHSFLIPLMNTLLLCTSIG